MENSGKFNPLPLNIHWEEGMTRTWILMLLISLLMKILRGASLFCCIITANGRTNMPFYSQSPIYLFHIQLAMDLPFPFQGRVAVIPVSILITKYNQEAGT